MGMQQRMQYTIVHEQLCKMLPDRVYLINRTHSDNNLKHQVAGSSDKGINTTCNDYYMVYIYTGLYYVLYLGKASYPKSDKKMQGNSQILFFYIDYIFYCKVIICCQKDQTTCYINVKSDLVMFLISHMNNNCKFTCLSGS